MLKQSYYQKVMISYPAIKISFDRRKQSSPTKEGVVEIEIYFKAKRKWILTGVKVLPNMIESMMSAYDRALSNITYDKTLFPIEV